MECAGCKKSVPNKGETACPHCGQDFVKTCDKCGVFYPEGMNFCNQCGSKLQTNVFSLDVEESTDIEEDMMPEEDMQEQEEKRKKKQKKKEPPAKKKKETKAGDKEKKKKSSSAGTMMAPPPSIAGASEKDFSYVDKIFSGGFEEDSSSVSEMEFESGEEEKEEDDTLEIESIDIPISADEVLRKSVKDIPLTFVDHAKEYKIELKDIDAHMKLVEGDSFLPLQELAIVRLRKGVGGLYSFEGDSGAGKNEIIHHFESYAESNDIENLTIVSSESSEYDFDYMVFIYLLRSLFGITELDTDRVAVQISKFLEASLPMKKVHSLAALLCLNFTPLKTKLPREDVDYLISYALYKIAKKKPILWIIHNSSALNVRTLKLFSRLKKVLNFVPVAVVFSSNPGAIVLDRIDSENKFKFNGFHKDVVIKKVEEMLSVNRLPVDIEKVLLRFSGNLQASTQMIELMKEQKLIFKMKNSWRFSKLSDSFEPPKTLADVIAQRLEFLPEDSTLLLRRLALLNLHRIPMMLYVTIFGDEFEGVQSLSDAGFIVISEEDIAFPSRTILSIMKKGIRIGDDERAFYRMVVDKIAQSINELPDINTRWLLLSYINLSGRIGSTYNSFLYSSAIYMEKLGFFEVAQRSYQTILQSFSPDDLHDDMSWLLSIKNARLWRFIEKKWARIFWDNMLNKAKKQNMLHIVLLTEGNIILLNEEQLDLRGLVEIIKELHGLGCIEDELILIDRAVDVLLENGSLQDAYTLALRGYTILYDSLVGPQAEDPQQLPLFIHTLYLRSSSQFAEVCIAMEQFDFAKKVLSKSLEIARNRKASYFIAKISLLLVKIEFFGGGDDWETSLKEGLDYAMKGMEFKILRAFFLFLEENTLEKFDWLEPYLECKNWLNL